MVIKVYYGEHCQPCHQIVKAIEEGRFTGEDVELVDIESDEGFREFSELVLKKGEGAVPSAYKDGQRCNIKIVDDNSLLFDCPKSPSGVR